MYEGAALSLFGFMVFYFFVAPIPASGPATDGRAANHLYLKQFPPNRPSGGNPGLSVMKPFGRYDL